MPLAKCVDSIRFRNVLRQSTLVISTRFPIIRIEDTFFGCINGFIKPCLFLKKLSGPYFNLKNSLGEL